MKRIAVTNGDRLVGSAKMSATTRQLAVNLTDPGAVVDSNGPVYVVELRGKFVAKSAKVPKGAPFPVGSVLTVVIDVRSMKVTDWGLTDNTSNLSKVGRTAVLTF